jgi:hypothetical protein
MTDMYEDICGLAYDSSPLDTFPGDVFHMILIDHLVKSHVDFPAYCKLYLIN